MEKNTTFEQKRAVQFDGFITEWKPEQFRAINTAIRIHFSRKGADTKHHGHVCFSRFEEWANCFGLAYTSSSEFAMYSVCNTYVYFDVLRNYTYSHFAIGKDGKYYAILWDREEKELIIQL